MNLYGFKKQGVLARMWRVVMEVCNKIYRMFNK